MTYVEAMEGFERRPPREYPKYVVRDGVEYLAVDAEHEKRIVSPDPDKGAAGKRQKSAAASDEESASPARRN